MFSSLELGVLPYKVEAHLQSQLVIDSITNPLKYVVFNSKKVQELQTKLCIENKACCLNPKDYFNIVTSMSYADRMKVYECESQKLVFETLKRLFQREEASTITHVLTCSCTGAYAPGLHDRICNEFESISNHCKRFGLNYMGCHGGVKALQLAASLANEHSDNRVLVVCVELCSLHTFPPRMLAGASTLKMDIISNLLFADGCATFIVDSKSNQSNGLEILETHTIALKNSEQFMTWRMDKNQYTMFIDKEIKKSIEADLPQALEDVLGEQFNASKYDLVVHPGGPSILRSVEKCLNGADISESWTILKKLGNMSSPTILYVLDEYIRNRKEKKDKIIMIAFGPGITIEIAILKANDIKAYQQQSIRVDKSLPTVPLWIEKSPTGRSFVKEIMDTRVDQSAVYSLNDNFKAMRSLKWLHQILFYNKPFYDLMKKLQPSTVVEIGCGGGYLAQQTAKLLPKAQVIGVDRNPVAIEWAEKDIGDQKPNNLTLTVTEANVKLDAKGQTSAEHSVVDVVYLCDVLHHMDDDEVNEFLQQQYARVQIALIILDLHRHWLASLLFYIPGFLICNWVARLDGWTSIQKAFKRHELVDFALKAGVKEEDIELQWIWPFRWMLTLKKPLKNKTKKSN